VAQDLRRLKNGGIGCIRIAYNEFNDPQSEALALFAKARGFYVIIGGEWRMLDPSQLSELHVRVLREAFWAQAHGIDQLSVGNEQEARLTGISFSGWANDVVALAAQVHKVYAGRVSYEASGYFVDNWPAIDLGSLDLLGLNVYGGYAFNAHALQENIAAHGVGHVYISETNCDVFHVCKTDEALAEEMKGDLLKLIHDYPQTAFYVYTWRAAGSDFPSGVANYPKTLKLLGIR
jgi:hypothetical protein